MMGYSAVQKAFLFSLILLVSGCIYEDPGKEQPPVITGATYETKIAFQCMSGSVDIFKHEITENATITSLGKTVAVYVYDKSTKNLVKEQTVLKHALGQFQGVTLSLTPGEYEIRCWGNVNAQTIFYDEDKLSTARLTNINNYPDQGTVISDDPLYYGAISLVVPQNGFNPEATADTIFFKAAHLRLNLAFTGNMSITPKVEIRNLIPTFDFEMNVAADRYISYFPKVEKRNNSLMNANFNILRTAYKQENISYDYTKDIEIVVKDSKVDTLIYAVNLEEWMMSKGITLHAQNDNRILSMPDSLSSITTGATSLPPIRINLPYSSNPSDTTTTPPVDTIPIIVPPISDQALFFHMYYNDNQTNDLFLQFIESVNLYVYEKYSGLRVPISKDFLSKIDLSMFQGIRFSLPPINTTSTAPREYDIVCWANFNGNSEVINDKFLYTSELSNVNIGTNDTIRTNDRLFFGKTSVKVMPDYTYVTEDIHFRSAHTQFTVSVKGMTAMPKIKVSGLSSSSDFEMNNAQLNFIDYYPRAVSKSDSVTTFIFNAMRLTDASKNNVKITLLDTDNTVIHEVSLREKEIAIEDKSDYMYIYIKGIPTANRVGININVTKDGVSDEIW